MVQADFNADQISHLQQWQGRSESRTESITCQSVECLAATLNLTDIDAVPGAPLPPLWHWTNFTPRTPQHELGVDGHPRLGGFLPPIPLPRRMWAGSRIQWLGTPKIGEQLQKRSIIKSVTHKSGTTGHLVFVIVEHNYSVDNRVILSEEQDLVYRAAPTPNSPQPSPLKAPAKAEWSREVVPDPVLLFRYSALTFNAHRIHYDRPYATAGEGYPGLVVQGPLIATLLADLACRHSGYHQFEQFRFKAIRPTCDLKPFYLHGQPDSDGSGATLWSQDHEGWLTMEARVQWR
jgi:3-methylfumaryl-CoA hydratase